jgi:hypothetical protein
MGAAETMTSDAGREIPSTLCPSCGRRSYSAGDIEHRFCGACGWHEDLAGWPSVDAALGEEAARIARRIMEATDGERDGLIVGAALWRCIAGMYARLALDAGEPAELARHSLTISAAAAGELAQQLVEQARSDKA